MNRLYKENTLKVIIIYMDYVTSPLGEVLLVVGWFKSLFNCQRLCLEKDEL